MTIRMRVTVFIVTFIIMILAIFLIRILIIYDRNFSDFHDRVSHDL